jgi:CHAD domain-containing protein
LLAFKTEFRRFPEARAILRALRRREEKLIRKARGQMKSAGLDELKRFRKLAGRILKARFTGESSPRRGFAIMIRAVDDASEAVKKLRNAINPARPATIHRLRGGFKRFRYMVEALEEILPGPATERSREMQTFQAMMGDVQDTEVLLADLERLHSKEMLNAATLQTLRADLLRRRSRQIATFMGAQHQIPKFWRSLSRCGTFKVKDS